MEIEVSFDTLFGQKSRDIFLFSYCVAGINFKDIYTRYSEIRREKPIMLTTDWETELAEAVYPFIRDAYTKLGDQRVKALKYRVGAIQRTPEDIRHTGHRQKGKGNRYGTMV